MSVHSVSFLEGGSEMRDFIFQPSGKRWFRGNSRAFDPEVNGVRFRGKIRPYSDYCTMPKDATIEQLMQFVDHCTHGVVMRSFRGQLKSNHTTSLINYMNRRDFVMGIRKITISKY